METVPLGVSAPIGVGPGIADVLLKTRDQPTYRYLQDVLNRLGDVECEGPPSETNFREAWKNLSADYAGEWARKMATQSQLDEAFTQLAVWAFVVARVLGCLLVPEVQGLDPGPALDHAVIHTIEAFGPELMKGVRAQLAVPRLTQALIDSVRCSTVVLNVGLMRSRGTSE